MPSRAGVDTGAGLTFFFFVEASHRFCSRSVSSSLGLYLSVSFVDGAGFFFFFFFFFFGSSS